MNSENSKTSKPHILKLKLTDKLDLRVDKKVIVLSNLSIYYTWNNIKVHTIIINLKNRHQHGMKNLHYLMDHIRYLMFKIISSIFLKSMEKKLIRIISHQ